MDRKEKGGEERGEEGGPRGREGQVCYFVSSSSSEQTVVDNIRRLIYLSLLDVDVSEKERGERVIG